MIDRETGCLRISRDIILKPNDAFNSIEFLPIGEPKEINDMGNGYVWLVLKNVFIDNHYFNLALCFKNGLLYEMNFVMNNVKSDIKANSYSWFEEEEEMKKAERFTQWLKDEIGGEGKYKWGEAWAGYDEKSGFSSLGIRYL